MQKKLGDIATVQMGFPFRSRIEPDKDGNVSVIQMSNLGENNLKAHTDLLKVYLKNISHKHLVKQKDLIFRSRGKTINAVIIDKEIEQAVVAAPLIRIRVTEKDVIPEYLLWFMNQPLSQAFLHGRATGTSMPMIGKSTLEDLRITIPDLETQRQIVILAHLSDKEQKLMKRLAKANGSLVQKTLKQLVTNPKKSY